MSTPSDYGLGMDIESKEYISRSNINDKEYRQGIKVIA
jgi:hypothetical protein